MEDLQVQFRTWRVGGELTFGDRTFDPDAIIGWANANPLLLGLVAFGMLMIAILWRSGSTIDPR